MKTLHYKLLGLLALSLGFIGAFLPLLPTTCFILLAAWCFAKSSPRLYNWLLSSALFGEVIHQWEQQRCMSARIRFIAVASMLASSGISILLLNNLLLQFTAISLLSIGIYYVMSIKLCRLSLQTAKID